MKRSIVLFLLALPLAGFSNNITETERQIFIETWSTLAVEEMMQHGIPSSITLAQAILESSWGRGATAINANNYFGIKCYNGWVGPTFYARDDEPEPSCFRKYDDVVMSFRDHSLFLKENPRYQPLFQYAINDYQSWAKTLKECGYATDPAYAEKLIDIIERYALFVYDYAMPVQHLEVVQAREVEQAPPAPDKAAFSGKVQGRTLLAAAVMPAPSYRLPSRTGEAPDPRSQTPVAAPPISTQPQEGPTFLVLRPVHESWQ